MESKPLTFGSLFAGIGGMDLGLERAGMECRWQVEIDPYCSKVLERHWPKVKRYGDITTVDGDDLERVDLIAGGFPCQDISHAGTGAGIEGVRSGLWKEFARLVGGLRPKFVFVENVPALRGRGLTVVLQDIMALGYDAEWNCIPASALGTPHERDRIWIVAYPDNSRQLQPQGRQCDIGRRTRHGAEENANHDGAGRQEQRRIFTDGPEQPTAECVHWWSAEPGVVRMVHGIPHRVDRLSGLGNAVVPQVAEWIGRRIIESLP